MFERYQRGELTRWEFIALLYLQAKPQRTITYTELAKFVGCSVPTAGQAMENLLLRKFIHYVPPRKGQQSMEYSIMEANDNGKPVLQDG